MKYNLNEMNSLDIFMSRLKKEEFDKINPGITKSKATPMTLLNWDIFISGYHKRLDQFRKNNELKEVLSFAKKFNWKNDLNRAFSENDYEAIIITDKNQKILWVNDGFTKMTGYSKGFAISKTPKFLQGNKTSEETRKRIREKIQKDHPFKEVIVNHKKDNSTYKCEVKIIPLYSDKTTHYIAFERKVI